ncbi:YidH family protein [Prauserella oleivorans]|uniref:YidH family protein n=1 Tax=Prauserella oleivorans TaxID=1478153 RepID=A0ABW5W9U1_9PSEU
MTERDDTAEESEPDYRFTLANERTFLAWIRTALGLVAGGVAVQQLVPDLAAEAPRTALASVCIGLAFVLAGAAYPRWRTVQSAMRRGAPLPRSALLVVLAAGVLVITVFALILVLTA